MVEAGSSAPGAAEAVGSAHLSGSAPEASPGVRCASFLVLHWSILSDVLVYHVCLIELVTPGRMVALQQYREQHWSQGRHCCDTFKCSNCAKHMFHFSVSRQSWNPLVNHSV